MRTNDPRITWFWDRIKHRSGNITEQELVRITFQFAYGAGFTDCANAEAKDDITRLMHMTAAQNVAQEYFPETKTCPKCGHKWGGP